MQRERPSIRELVTEPRDELRVIHFLILWVEVRTADIWRVSVSDPNVAHWPSLRLIAQYGHRMRSLLAAWKLDEPVPGTRTQPDGSGSAPFCAAW